MTSSVEGFFESYRAAFERMDAAAIAGHFASPVHVASDTGGGVHLQALTAEEWRDALEQLLTRYRAIDVGSAHVRELSSDALSSRLVQARVVWSLHDRAGRELYEFNALYTLARHDDSSRIAAIAHDEIPQFRRCLARLQAERRPSGGTSASAAGPG
jgi:hypothetical protein